MRTRLAVPLTILVLAAAVPAGATFAEDFTMQLKRHVKRVYRVKPGDVSVTSDAKTWKKCASLTMNVPQSGTVKVSASGWILVPGAGGDNRFLLSLGTAPGVPGSQSWIYDCNRTVTTAPFHVEMVFPVAAGTRSFHLNGMSDSGDPGSVLVVTNLIEAEFLSTAISPAPARH